MMTEKLSYFSDINNYIDLGTIIGHIAFVCIWYTRTIGIHPDEAAKIIKAEEAILKEWG